MRWSPAEAGLQMRGRGKGARRRPRPGGLHRLRQVGCLLATDPPYGVSLDGSWRDGVFNKMGPAEKTYMRGDGSRNTTISGDTRVDWSEAFELVPSLAIGYVWHAGVHAGEVAAGLERIGFEIVSQVIWDKGLFAMGAPSHSGRHHDSIVGGGHASGGLPDENCDGFDVEQAQHDCPMTAVVERPQRGRMRRAITQQGIGHHEQGQVQQPVHQFVAVDGAEEGQ